MWIGMKADGAMVQYTNITLKDCIRAAYRVRDFQIEGPAWIGNERFEITAKLPQGARLDQIPEMLQGLLAERFHLSLRRGSKEQSVYAVRVGDAPPKLKPSQANANAQTPTAVGPDGRPRPPMMFGFLPSGVWLAATSCSFASFVELMSRFTARPVIDLTGIQGQFDFELMFAPETMQGVPIGSRPASDTTQAPSEPGPSIFDAVRQQYGLKLEASKAPMELLTVTYADRAPTAN